MINLGASCGTVPESPNILLCIFDAQAEVSRCRWTRGEVETIKDLALKRIEERSSRAEETILKPIPEMHRFVCTDPPGWEANQNYIDDLVRVIELECRK